MRTRAVVFDLWGTLIPIDPTPWRRTYRQIATILGVAPEDFRREWSHASDERSSADLHGSLRAVCDALDVDVTDPVVSLVLALRRATLRSVFKPRGDAVPTILELRGRGLLTALLTNCDSDVPEAWSRSPLAGLMDAEVFSCLESLLKPDARIYRLVAERLGVEPAECLFVGDGASDELSGAVGAGMRALLLRAPDTSPPKDWRGTEIANLHELVAQVG